MLNCENLKLQCREKISMFGLEKFSSSNEDNYIILYWIS